MADKAEANRLKRVRRAQEKLGDKFVQEDAYRQRELAANSARTTTLLTAAATNIIIPLPFQPQTLKANNPDLWAFLSSGKPITATKSMDPMQAAAIWYLELDAKHSFNTSLKVPGANYAVAVMASYEYLCDNTKLDVTPALLIPYVIACHEKRFTPDIFIARDEFINLWLTSPDDLPQYGRRQCDRITKVARDLRKAINEIGGSDPFAQMKQDLEEALNEDVDTGDLNEEGNVLYEKTASKLDTEDADGDFKTYDGEDSIERGLSGRDLAYRKDKYSEWFDTILWYMDGRLAELEEQINQNNEAAIDALRNKLLLFWEVKSCQIMAKAMGFDKFA